MISSFFLYYYDLVTKMINSLQEKYFNIYHVDIILWENRMSLQERKETSMKEFFHIKTFEPNYSLLGYKSLNKERKRKMTKGW